MAPKVLIVGAVHGRLSKAIEKITKLHTKNQFSFAIVTGDLFGAVDSTEHLGDRRLLLDGTIMIPLPVYFTVGEFVLPAEIIARIESNEMNEVCPNLIYLGRKGTMKTAEGIKIVALGGTLVQNKSSVTEPIGKYDPFYMQADARGLFGAHSADILITNQWPAHIARGSENPIPESLHPNQGSQPIADLCSKLRPRYHFSSSPGASWDREPFKHPVEFGSLDFEPITRFRSLAGLSGGSAKDWMAAFNLDPNEPPPPAPNATSSPFMAAPVLGNRQREADSESYARFGNGNGERSHKRRAQKNPDDCFMCMNKSDFRLHLVVWIGKDDLSFLTVPRGPLPLPTTFPGLSYSGHALIIPTYHAGDALKSGPRAQTEVDTEFAEMSQFRKSLCKMIQVKGKGELGAVCWETNRTGVRHLHWQFMPASYEQIKSGVLEGGFRQYASKNDYPALKSCDADSQLELTSDYFRLWIWTPHIAGSDPVEAADEVSSGRDSGSEKSLYFPIPQDIRFNFQFGREVMALLLKLGSRIDWQQAMQSDAVEQQEAEALRGDFEAFCD